MPQCDKNATGVTRKLTMRWLAVQYKKYFLQYMSALRKKISKA